MPFYRTVVRVSPLYLQHVRRSNAERTQGVLLADLERRMARLGAANVLTTMQDPTDNMRFTIIGDWPRPPSIGLSDDVLSIASVEPTQAPPAAIAREGTKIPWDNGLSREEIAMVEHALLNEQNPRHLHGIASTMEPYFPIASSVLDAKGDLIEKKRLMDRSASRDLERIVVDEEVPSQLAYAIRNESQRLRAYGDRIGIPSMVLREEIKRTASSLVDPNGPQGRPVLASAAPLARQLVRPIIVQGVPLKILSPYRVHLALPPDAEDGELNPASLQLMLGTQKPQMSRIANETNVTGRLRQLDGSPPIRMEVGRPLTLVERKYLRARSHMERARQAIERRRWVDWYRRRKAAGMVD